MAYENNIFTPKKDLGGTAPPVLKSSKISALFQN